MKRRERDTVAGRGVNDASGGAKCLSNSLRKVKITKSMAIHAQTISEKVVRKKRLAVDREVLSICARISFVPMRKGAGKSTRPMRSWLRTHPPTPISQEHSGDCRTVPSSLVQSCISRINRLKPIPLSSVLLYSLSFSHLNPKCSCRDRRYSKAKPSMPWG